MTSMCLGYSMKKIKDKLLDSKNITLKKALEMTEACESAKTGLRSLHIGEGATVNQVRAMKAENRK